MLHRMGARKILLIIGGFLCYMMADGCTFSIGILYSEFLKKFNQSNANTAVLPGLIYAVPQLLGFIVCPLIETIGSGAGAIIGGLFLAMSFAVSRFVCTFQWMYFTLGFLASVGLEMTYVSGIMAVTKGFCEGKYLGLALGITVSGSGIGVFMFNPLLNYLIGEFTWKGALTVESAIFLNIIVAGCIFNLAFTLAPQIHKNGTDDKYEKPNIVIVVPEQNQSQSFFRQLSQSHSAEALDIFREPYMANNSKHFQPSDSDQRTSTILTKTQTKYCEPFYKPISTQAKCSSLDRRINTGDGFLVQLPVDERTASFVRRLSLYSSPNIKGSSQNMKDSHKVSRETMSSQPSLTINDTEDISPANNAHLQSDYDIQLLSDHDNLPSSIFKTFLKDLKSSFLSLFLKEVWTNKNILLFYLATFMFSLSVVVVWSFSYDKSINMLITYNDASLLVSLIGAGSCFGQIFFGYISDFIPAIRLYSFGCLIAGIVTVLLSHITSYAWLAILHFIFGFSQGVCYALFSVILVHYGGVELYPASLAIYLFFSGSGNLIGTSFAGFLYDRTGRYEAAYTSGGCILVATAITVIPLMCTWRRHSPALT